MLDSCNFSILFNWLESNLSLIRRIEATFLEINLPRPLCPVTCTGITYRPIKDSQIWHIKSELWHERKLCHSVKHFISHHEVTSNPFKNVK